MRIWHAVVLTLVLGLISGMGLGAAQFYSHPWKPSAAITGGELQSTPDDTMELHVGGPKAVIDNTIHDFGVMDSMAQGRHAFVFTNAGDAPLQLYPGAASCKCTVAKMPEEDILPGGSVEVVVEWSGKENFGVFSHSVTVHTNDPRRPRVALGLVGRMRSPIRIIPPELVFSTVTAGRSRTAKFRVYWYLDDPFEVTAWTAADSEHFDMVLTPLGPEEVAEEEYATNGYLAEVTVKPGLPLGRFNSKITLTTTAEKTAELEIPVSGIISSEISILGSDWNEKTNILALGTMRSDKDRKWNLLLRVGGADPEQVRFQVAEVFPDTLKVKLGETNVTGAGRIAVTPLEIGVLKGARPGHYLGPKREDYGRIRIVTDHSKTREIIIYVKFLVRD